MKRLNAFGFGFGSFFFLDFVQPDSTTKVVFEILFWFACFVQIYFFGADRFGSKTLATCVRHVHESYFPLSFSLLFAA